MSEKVSITKSKLDSLANAIASVGETSVPKTIAQMESAVLELTIPPTISSLTVTPSATDQVFTGAYPAINLGVLSFQKTGTSASFSIDLSEIEYGETYHIQCDSMTIGNDGQYYNYIAIDTDWVASENGTVPFEYISHANWNVTSIKLSKSAITVAVSTGRSTIVNIGGAYTPTDFIVSKAGTVDGYNPVTVNAMPTGTAGTPTATKGTVSNHSISVTPSVINTTGYITGGTLTGTAVTVSASELVSGTKSITSSGTTDVTNYASASVAAGTAGTPTVTKGTVSNHSINVTPSVTNTTGYITGGTKTGTAVTVDVTELESGTKTITENGTGISVSGYSTVDVAVQAGTIIDDGDGNINLSPTGEVAVITPLTVNQNGTYTAPSNTGYSPVTVNITKDNYKDVNFIDYDGTLLYSYTKTEFANLSALPANPTHTGLTSQGWNWTKAQITAQLTAMPNQPVWIGQMYVTTSGATEIDITLDNANYLSPYLMIAVDGTVSVDWGDNTTASTVTGSSLITSTYTIHQYASIGSYTIKISVTNGSFSFYNEKTRPSVLSVYDIDTNRNASTRYSGAVNDIRIGSSASIGANAFRSCYSLQSITIPSSVTSIGANVFYNCCALQSATIPSNVTSIEDNMFYNCSSLRNVTIPSSVTSFGGYIFYNCRALQSVAIPSGVTSVGYSIFYGCYTLQSAAIPSSLTSITDSMFDSCYSLQSVTIPSGVTSINKCIFWNCYSLQSITIPSSVTSIGYGIFTRCYSLQSITIPSSVTGIGNSAFDSCYGVLEYHFQRTMPPVLDTNAFKNIVDGTIIYVPSAYLDRYKTASNWSTYASYMQGE